MTGTFVQPDIESDATQWAINVDNSVAAMAGIGAAFSVHEQATPNMTVRIDAGAVQDSTDGSFSSVAAQNSGTITAPSVQPRKDIVYIDIDTGTVGVETGSESASPVDPTIPTSKYAIARINLTTSTTAIANTDIDDLRTWVVKTALGALTSLGTEIGNLGTGDALAGLEAVGALGAVSDGIPIQIGMSSTQTGVNAEVRTYYSFIVSRAYKAVAEHAKVLSGGVGPTGADLIFDVTKNGTTIYTTKPKIVDGATTLTAGTLKTDGTEIFAADDICAFLVTQVGSTTPGQQIVFTLDVYLQ